MFYDCWCCALKSIMCVYEVLKCYVGIIAHCECLHSTLQTWSSLKVLPKFHKVVTTKYQTHMKRFRRQNCAQRLSGFQSICFHCVTAVIFILGCERYQNGRPTLCLNTSWVDTNGRLKLLPLTCYFHYTVYTLFYFPLCKIKGSIGIRHKSNGAESTNMDVIL